MASRLALRSLAAGVCCFSQAKRHSGANVQTGVVSLTGAAPHWYEKAHAANVASRVLGIRKVVNEIEVEPMSETTTRTHSGSAVADDIRNSLGWHWATYGSRIRST